MIRRFFREGVRDAERRLGWVTAGAPAEVPEVMRVVTSSRAIGAVGRAFAVVSGAVESSAFVTAAKGAAARWSRLALPDRRLAGGVVLLTAVAVHVGMMVWHGVPPGWLWLILPGMGVAVAGLLIVAAGAGGPAGTRR